MRLRTRYALVLVGILLVLGTVVVGSGELFKQQAIEQEQEELDNTTRLAAAQIDEAIADEEDVIRQAALSLDRDSTEVRAEQLEQLLDNHVFSSAIVANINGTITGMYGLQEDQEAVGIGDSVTEVGFLNQGTFERILGGSTRVERVHSFAQFDDFALTIGAPVLSPDGQDVEEVVVGSMFLDSTRLFSPLTPLETSQRTAKVTGTTFEGEQVTILPADNEFDDSLTSKATISKTGWTLTAERDEGALTNRLQFLQLIQFGSLVVVLLTVLGLGFYQYRTTLQQTNRLLDGFSELTEGNFEYNLELEAAEEWDQIGEGFNTMTDGLMTRERQILERERRLSVLNRVLRHNLQNDMTVIQGFAEVIPAMDDEEQRQEAADKIIEKSRGLVEHGKKARRLETVMENAEEGTTEVDIVAQVRDSLDANRTDHPEVDVSFESTDDGRVDAVAGVEFGVEQLIENAFVHNTSDNPRVEVTVDRDGDDVVVTVEDNGPGIPEHERDVLVHDEETSLEHGSGIGLWLAYWSILKSNGELAFGDQDEGGHAAVRLRGCEPSEYNGGHDA
ncbi:sensor histidine kinase [Halovenus salina]|uniref:histidine kinase n=1 Tax=Halovenus salina TaxID=1510225 RepID=A0ABD5W2C7_9EURY|nr:ATP-binding protein [Halovenus salina]